MEVGMSNRRGDQQGAQTHPEGGHGERTRQRLREDLESGRGEAEEYDAGPPAPRPGKHRVHEDRQQHDEAEKNSEKNRLAREADDDSSGEAESRESR
jgi:hypothetical protein